MGASSSASGLSAADPTTTEMEQGADSTSTGSFGLTLVWKRDWLQNICYWYNVTIYIGVIGALCVGGLAGNTLTRLTLWSDRTKSATVFLVICLSIVDDMVLVIYGFMLMAYMLSFMDGIRETEFPNFYARIWNVGWALCSTLQVIAAWMVLVISVQRYMAICKPVLAKKLNTVKSAGLTTLVVVLSSVAFNFPHLFSEQVERNPNTGRLENVYTTFGSTESYRVGYEQVAYYVLVYMIPMSILVYTSVRLLAALRQSKKKRAQMVTNSQQTTTSRLQDEMTRSVVVVVLVFCVCQLANPIRRILDESLSPSQQTCGSFYFFYMGIAALSVIFNSAANFFIFCLCAHGFRKQVMRRLSRNRRVHPDGRDGPTTASNSANQMTRYDGRVFADGTTTAPQGPQGHVASSSI